MKTGLYQKKGLIVGQLALELLGKKVNDRILSISEYEEKYEVARGTIQNAFTFLKEKGAIETRNKGHQGTYIEKINYSILLQYSLKDRIMGIMPLPYSKLYEGLASALYEVLKDGSLSFNLAYVRGAQSRIEMVVNGSYDFAVCSLFAAKKARLTSPVKVLCDFGPYSYLSKHVLVLKDQSKHIIENGMKVGIDNNSYDQRDLTLMLCEGKAVHLIPMQSHKIIAAIQNQEIDAGVWNYDEIKEQGYLGLTLVDIEMEEAFDFNSAAIIVSEDSKSLENSLMKYLDIEHIKEIQQQVVQGSLIPSY